MPSAPEPLFAVPEWEQLRGKAEDPQPSRTRRIPVQAAILSTCLIAIDGGLFVTRPPGVHDEVGRSTTATAVTPPSTAQTSQSGTRTLTFVAIDKFVRDFYGRLPDEAATSWQALDENVAAKFGRADFDNFWSSITSVSVLSVRPQTKDTVIARLRYVTKSGMVDIEDRWLTVVIKLGQMYIFDTARMGPA